MMLEPMITPMRQPMASHSTAITISTAWARLTKKPRTAASISADCQCTRWTSMPIGRSETSSARRASTRSPRSTTLTPGWLVMASAIAGCPS